MDGWLPRFTIRTQRTYRASLRVLIRQSHVTHPRQITTAHVAAWTNNARIANNTARDRWGILRGFLTWCAKRGEYDAADIEEVCDPIMIRRVPRTYGRVQGANPARWLSTAECERLVAACSAGSTDRPARRDDPAPRAARHASRGDPHSDPRPDPARRTHRVDRQEPQATQGHRGTSVPRRLRALPR